VGGDCGGGSTKLGVSYCDFKKQLEYVPIVVFDGKDNYESLSTLAAAGVTPFVGTSVQYPHVFAVLQHLINSHGNAFLNGDWPFINTVLGLMSPAAMHPCPVCIVRCSSLLAPAVYRNVWTDNALFSRIRQPLLSIPPERIVPLPLHILLGLCNRIIDDTLPLLFDRGALAVSIKSVKRTSASAASTGLFELYHLTGPEICKWLDQRKMQQLIADHPNVITCHGGRIGHQAFLRRCNILTMWMTSLRDLLLFKGRFTHEQLAQLQAVVKHIQQEWAAVTGTAVTPKVHMLSHCVEFAFLHRHLGRMAESTIESCHASSNRTIAYNHFNLGKNFHEKLRRAQVGLTLKAVQPALLQSRVTQ
jgi:hypothetical protein